MTLRQLIYNISYWFWLNLLSSITAVNTSFSNVAEQYKHCSVCIFVVKCLLVECLFFVPWAPVFVYCLLVTDKITIKTGKTLTKKRFAFHLRNQTGENDKRRKTKSLLNKQSLLSYLEQIKQKKEFSKANSLEFALPVYESFLLCSTFSYPIIYNWIYSIKY